MIESDCAPRLMAAVVPVVPSREHVAQVEVVLETLPDWCPIARQPILGGPRTHSRGLRGLLYAKALLEYSPHQNLSTSRRQTGMPVDGQPGRSCRQMTREGTSFRPGLG